MAAKKELPPAQFDRLRYLYEHTVAPVEDIVNGFEVSTTWLHRRARELGWRKRRSKAGPFHFARVLSEAAAQLPARAEEIVPPAPPIDRDRLDAVRLALAVRLHETAATVLEALVRTVAVIQPADQAQAQRSARTLAQIAHALREVAYLKEPEQSAQPHDPDHDDDPVPRDLDQFRRELARRIRGFIETRGAGPDGGGRDPVSVSANPERPLG